MNLMIVPGKFVCSSFLCVKEKIIKMFIVSKVLLISSATVIVRAGGVIWLLLCKEKALLQCLCNY